MENKKKKEEIIWVCFDDNRAVGLFVELRAAWSALMNFS